MEADSTQPAPAAPATDSTRRRFNWALALVLLALLLIGASWWDARREIGVLQQELARRLAEADNVARSSQATANQTQEMAREAQHRLTALEGRLAESQNQQVALEALYQELSRNRDEWSLAEVEQIITIANQQLQLAGNIRGALIALQAADTRLQRIDKPQLISLRKVLDQDIERLKAVPFVDTVGFAVKLDNLSLAVEALPPLAEARPTENGALSEEAGPVLGFWRKLGHDTWQEIKQLVRVQHMDRSEAPLLSPSQSFFLRENLKLRLLSARLALLARDESSYKADLRAAQDWLTRFYDGRARSTQNALAIVRQLYDSPISIRPPDISASLDAVHNYRLTREPAPSQ